MKISILVILSFLLLSFQNFPSEISKSTRKKIDKNLAKIWTEKVVHFNAVQLTESQRKSLPFTISKNYLNKIVSNNNTIAYLYLSKGKGKMNEFDYMVVFNKDISILKIVLLVYREEYGGEIGSNRWLKQFIGKTNPQKLKFGYDIQNISGATISARSLTENVKAVLKKMQELKKRGVI